MEGTGEGRGFFCSPKLAYLCLNNFVADCRNDEKYSETRGNWKGAERENLSLSPFSFPSLASLPSRLTEKISTSSHCIQV